MFTIVTNPRLNLLRVTLSGFFTVEEVGSFAVAAQKAVAEMGCASGDWVHICDISQMTLQSQKVAEMFSGFINHPERRSKRLAIVTGGAPVRMQIRRLMVRDDAAVFDTVREAESWLFSRVDNRLSA